jgi:hypothetical protein
MVGRTLAKKRGTFATTCDRMKNEELEEEEKKKKNRKEKEGAKKCLFLFLRE